MPGTPCNERLKDRTMNTPKFPHVTVKLSDEDGNAFFILARVKRALDRAGVTAAECQHFIEDATSGDYNHLLRVVMEWVEVE